MIKREEILRFAPTIMGEEAKSNHQGCPAGLDTKRRLYVKKVFGGLVAYCHHCNQAGFVRDLNSDGTRLRQWLFDKKGVGSPGVSKDIFDAPETMKRTNRYVTSVDILSWLHRYHLNPNGKDGLYFMESHSGDLHMPLYGPYGTYIGFQIRSFASTKTKYLTFQHKSAKCNAAWFGVGHLPTLVITEDFASARRIHRDVTDTMCVALLKTTMSIATEIDICQYAPDRILVWLDPDKAGQSGAAKIVKRLNYLRASSKPAIAMTAGIDEPKKFTPLGLQSVFTTILGGSW